MKHVIPIKISTLALTISMLVACGSDSKPLDTDSDGIPDQTDNCLNIANPDQSDLDDNGQGDACDNDIDGDGVANDSDLFPRNGSETIDTDSDGIGDNGDNCPSITNPAQENADDDAAGDACDALPNDATETLDFDEDGIGNNADPDDDNDTYNDDIDAFPFDQTEWLDDDKDNIGDNKDLALNNPDVHAADLTRLLETGKVTKFIEAPSENGVSYLGESSKHIGDVNNDGYPDLMLGDARYRKNDKSSGRAYLLFGQEGGFSEEIDLADLSKVPHIIFQQKLVIDEHANIGDGFTSIGDVNSDGIDDFMLSATFVRLNDDMDQTYSRLFIIHGREDWSSGAGEDNIITLEELYATSIVYEEDISYGRLGRELINIGDVNGDGYIDVVVSGTTSGNYGQARVYILFGGNHWHSDYVADIRDFTQLNNDVSLQKVGLYGTTLIQSVVDLGSSIKPLGDFNQDGFNDFILQSHYTSMYVVVFGRASDDWKDSYNTVYDEFEEGDGIIMALSKISEFRGYPQTLAIGDFNGDGVNDIASAELLNGLETAEGMVNILWGGRGPWPLNTAPDQLSSFYLTQLPLNDGGRYSSLLSLSDWNNDGKEELLFGKTGNIGDEKGLFMIDGRTDWDEVELNKNKTSTSIRYIDFHELAEHDEDFKLNRVGDMNGDGYEDFTVTGGYPRVVYLIYGFNQLYPESGQ